MEPNCDLDTALAMMEPIYDPEPPFAYDESDQPEPPNCNGTSWCCCQKCKR